MTMAYLRAYDQLQSDAVRLQRKLVGLLESLDQNLLQNDTSDQLTEKLVSIGGSFVLMLGVGALISLFGIVAGGVGLVVLFLVGFAISRGLSRFWFGKPRERSELKPREVRLLEARDELLKICNQRLLRAKVKKEPFACSYYPKKMDELEVFGHQLQAFSVRHLAYKYRFRQNALKKDWLVACHQMKKILAYDPA